ncbi:hypothetical protein GMMP15_1750009 [Candidatus Magnetomoraceae bacterium gMMP-15]
MKKIQLGSPAVNQIPQSAGGNYNGAPATDQRGETRPDCADGDDECKRDIGAYEGVVSPNNAPAITLPASPTFEKDSTNNTISGISIDDTDGDAQSLTITVTNGAVSSGTNNLTFTTGDGTDDALMAFSGSLADLNIALEALAFTPTANFTENASIQIQTDDSNGGTDDDTLNITISDTTTPQPTLSLSTDTFTSDTEDTNDNKTADSTPTFSGTGEAGGIVEIFADGTSLGSSTVDGSGAFTFTVALPNALADGAHSITAVITDTVGNISEPSEILQIIIDTTVFYVESTDGGNLENQSLAWAINQAQAGDTIKFSDSFGENQNIILTNNVAINKAITIDTSNAPGLKISGDTGVELTLSDTLAYSVPAGITNTIDMPISGGGSLNKVGAGTLTLSGNNNDYTGTIMVSEGILVITGDTTVNDLIIENGTQVVLANNAALTVNGNITIKGKKAFDFAKDNSKILLKGNILNGRGQTKLGFGGIFVFRCNIEVRQ